MRKKMLPCLLIALLPGCLVSTPTLVPLDGYKNATYRTPPTLHLEQEEVSEDGNAALNSFVFGAYDNGGTLARHLGAGFGMKRYFSVANGVFTPYLNGGTYFAHSQNYDMNNGTNDLAISLFGGLGAKVPLTDQFSLDLNLKYHQAIWSDGKKISRELDLDVLSGVTFNVGVDF